MPRRDTDLARASGAVALLEAGFDRLIALIHEFHGAVAKIPFDRIQPVPAVGAGSELTRIAHDGITDTVYGAVRAVGGGLIGAARTLLKVVERTAPQSAQSPSATRDAVVSAVNGAVGDYLARQRNPLAVRPGFFHEGRPLALNPEAIAAAHRGHTPRLAIFVHGLCASEQAWRFYVEDGDPETVPYGDRLAQRGYTPFYLRYNSGVHVSQSGLALSRLVARLVAAYPQPVEEIVLVGHSMGGLVARSALHVANRRRADWVPPVSNLVCLGTPHLGAPLEKAVHVGAALLDAFEVGRPWARMINGRSVGIKDLRYGYVADEHWRGRDPHAVFDDGRSPTPRLPHVRYHFIGSTIGAGLADLLGYAVGDGLVRLPSATARELEADTAVLFGVHHLRLLNHPQVFREIERRIA